METQDLIVEKFDGVRIIKFNRPSKKNALNTYIYHTLPKILNADAEDDSVVVTIITGVGDYYTSGNDIKAAAAVEDPNQRLENVRHFVEAFIKYPKLLICVVNGPAIGIGTTSAALCDIIYASDKAYFDTPFIKLGLCCEAGSSYTFVNLLGRSKASEMLLLGERLTVEDAFRLGFVSKIIPHSQIDNFINGLRQHGKISPNSIKASKNLITRNFKDILCECNNVELKQVEECMESEEFMNAIMKFMSRSSKL